MSRTAIYTFGRTVEVETIKQTREMPLSIRRFHHAEWRSRRRYRFAKFLFRLISVAFSPRLVTKTTIGPYVIWSFESAVELWLLSIPEFRSFRLWSISESAHKLACHQSMNSPDSR